MSRRQLLARSRAVSVASLLCLALSLPGCAGNIPSFAYEPPRSASTQQSERLRGMPSPTERLSVAVYAFSDQSGQRRRADRYAELSSAVTQGGASMVVTALKDLGRGRWFTVAEREGIENLLKERNIIRTTREAYGDRNPLPPLLFAGVLIEGAIVGYESNTSQGGFGARLLGIGGNSEFRRDQVTVNLRAVAVQTGEVVIALTTSKTIYSAQVAANIFRYVAEDKILELDAGAAVNEPMQVAVREAIERAVLEFAIRATEMNLIRFASEEDRQRVLASRPESSPDRSDGAAPPVPSMPPAAPIAAPQPAPPPAASAAPAARGNVRPAAAQRPAATATPPGNRPS